jgi:hypothetical protein
LEPRPTDVKVIEAIRNHFRITIQRAMLSTKLCTTQETPELLKMVQIMNGKEIFWRSNPVPHQNPPTEEIPITRTMTDTGKIGISKKHSI